MMNPVESTRDMPEANSVPVGLKQKTFDVPEFRGMNFVTVINCIGSGIGNTEVRKNGQTAHTWADTDYSITLLFDAGGICLGVEEERILKER